MQKTSFKFSRLIIIAAFLAAGFLVVPKISQAANIFQLFSNVKIFQGQSLNVYRPFICGTDTVAYGGQTYNTVLIGTQCWFKENLNAGTMLVNGSTMPSDPAPVANDPSSVQKWCYGNNATNNGAGGCSTGSAAGEGGLYTWAEMTGLVSSCNTTDCSGSITSPHQGICPTGWHIPSDAEYTTLTTYLSSDAQYQCGGDSTYIAKSLASVYTDWNTDLRSTCTINQLPPPDNNVSGFTGLPAGLRSTDGSFLNRGNSTLFWSASQLGPTLAWRRYLIYRYATVDRSDNTKAYGFSVRCLKD